MCAVGKYRTVKYLRNEMTVSHYSTKENVYSLKAKRKIAFGDCRTRIISLLYPSRRRNPRDNIPCITDFQPHLLMATIAWLSTKNQQKP